LGGSAKNAFRQLAVTDEPDYARIANAWLTEDDEA